MPSGLGAWESLVHTAMMPRMLICERLDTTDSTQREVLGRLSAVADLRPSGQAHRAFGLWTTQQTRGIASHGRRWQDSPDGGLAISIAWPDANSTAREMAWPIRWSLLTIAALEASYPILSKRLGVKWPNDVMAQQSKLAGVLVSRHLVHGEWWCIAGVGINLAWRELPEVGRPVTDLQRLGVQEPDPEKIVTALRHAADALLNGPSGETASDVWQKEYRDRDVAADKLVSVVHPVSGETLMMGMNRGLSPTGELILEVDGTQHRVAIGELSLRFVSAAVSAMS